MAAHSATVTTSLAKRGHTSLEAASRASCEKPAVQSDLSIRESAIMEAGHMIHFRYSQHSQSIATGATQQSADHFWTPWVVYILLVGISCRGFQARVGDQTRHDDVPDTTLAQLVIQICILERAEVQSSDLVSIHLYAELNKVYQEERAVHTCYSNASKQQHHHSQAPAPSPHKIPHPNCPPRIHCRLSVLRVICSSDSSRASSDRWSAGADNRIRESRGREQLLAACASLRWCWLAAGCRGCEG